MGDNEEVRSDMNQRLQSSFGTSSSTVKQSSFVMDQLAIPPINQSQFRSRHNFSGDRESGSKRVGIPPISPYSQIPTSRAINQQMGSQNYSHGPTHSRSLSQSSFFSLDSLPPLSPSPFGETPSTSISDQVSPDVSMEDRDANSQSLLPSSSFNKRSENLPPRKAHRRSISDIPFGFSSLTHQQQQAFPHFLPLSGSNSLELEEAISGSENSKATKAVQLVKREFGWERGGGDNNVEGIRDRKSQGEVVDDLFSAYMNLDGIDALNYSGIDDNKNGNENHEDLDSRASGTKTNEGDSSENEADSSMNEKGRLVQKMELSSLTEKREGIKRRADGDVALSGRHHRSVSMDSFMGKLHFGDESPKLPPSPGTCSGQLSPNNSIDDNSNAFGMEFGNGEFNGTELKKIMTNEKLAEIALADPKRAKRILANRQSAARSKERKMMYISELEHKVQTLQTEATTLSAQLTLLQRDSIGLTNQNNELKFRLQAMQQQAQLRDALNEALTAEVQRLKLATAEFSGESHPSKCMASQFSANPHVFLSQQQPQQQNCGTTAKSELN